MRNNALYFPYINVPEGPWFNHIALYWDEVLAIVPHDYFKRPQNATRFMMEALDAKLVRPVSPGRYTHGWKDFSQCFLTWIEGQLVESQSQRERIENCATPIPIHMEKLGPISDDLVRFGVARMLKYPWYMVVPWVGTPFMAYLAACLGMVSDLDACPITNDATSFRALGGRLPPAPEWNLTRVNIRRAILEELLPVPEGRLEVKALVNFKQKHRKKIKKFRDQIEDVCIGLSSIKSSQTRDEATDYKIRQLKEEAAEIEDEMKISWGAVVLRDVCPVLAGVGSYLADPKNPMAVGAAGLSLANAVYQVVSTTKDRRKNLDKPLAYAALARRRLQL